MKKDVLSKDKFKFKNVICDSNDHFEYLDFFLDHVKQLVVVVGVERFLNHIDMTSPTYYKRLNNRELWSYGEIKKAVFYYKVVGIIK